MRLFEKKSQVFMSSITAKTKRNLNQNDFSGFSSDMNLVQQSWLFADVGRRAVGLCVLQGIHNTGNVEPVKRVDENSNWAA